MSSLLDREVIGPPECPILHRWTLLPWNDRKHENHDARWKLMVHRFLPLADDRDMHDHPRGFVTLVLRGSYVDHSWDVGTNVIRTDELRPGSIRYRPAKHIHRTKVGSKGCWTIVVMGPIERAWGFWRDSRWLYWRDHERRYGFGMRCPTDEPNLPTTPAHSGQERICEKCGDELAPNELMFCEECVRDPRD